MPLFRTRFTLGNSVTTVAILAVCFALTRGLPWRFPATLSVLLIVAIYVPGINLIELLVIIAVAGVLLGLSTPTVVPNCRRPRGTPVTAPGPVGPVPIGLP